MMNVPNEVKPLQVQSATLLDSTLPKSDGSFPVQSLVAPAEPERNPAASENPRGDFIDVYADYADVLEAPRMMHEVVAIQMIASILNRKGVLIPHGTAPLTLDLWALLLSGSGGGRTTLVTFARPVLQAAQIEGLIRDTQWGSPQALYQDMAQNLGGLYIWGEFSEKMRMLNDPRFVGAKEWLTDRFDSLTLPEARTYRQTGRPQNTPNIVFAAPPRINILATSSEAWFFSRLAQEDSSGGFIPRWMIVRADGPTRNIPMPRSADTALVPSLASALTDIAKLEGTADLSLILHAHEEWYNPAKLRFQSQSNSLLAMAYFNRHRAHILKLAVIFEVSRSRTLMVTPESWERAVKLAKMLEDTGRESKLIG
jgi:hypothetical protein